MSGIDRRTAPELLTRPVSRRGALVLLGGLGLAVAGCSGGDDSSNATATTKGAARRRRPHDRRDHHHDLRGDRGGDVVFGDPRGDRRPVPGRRLERPRRAGRERRRAQGHPLELRRHERHRRRCAVHDPVHRRRRRQRLQAADRRGGLRVALRPRRQLLDVLAGRRPTRTTSAACRRSTPTASSPSPASSRPRYSGRWPHVHFEVYPSVDDGDERRRTSSRRRRSRCPRTCATRCTPRAATSRASRNLSQVSLATDMVFCDGVSLADARR